MSGDLAKLVDRLEGITGRLEKLEGNLKSGGGGGGGGGGGAAPSSGEGNDSVVAFDAIKNDKVPKFLELSAKIGGDMAEQAKLVGEAVDELRSTLVAAASCKKPSSPTALAAFLKPLSEKMNAVIAYRDERRGHKEFDHLSTLSEGIAALGWVSIEPTPQPFAVQMRAGAEFYSNKLLRQYKGKDEDQVAWVNAFTGFLKDMEAYIKEHHRTGLTFAGSEDPASYSGGGGGGSSAAKPAAAAAPSKAKPKLGGGAPGGDLFAALNKGGAITTGLKKVTKDMQTHKNKALRKGGVVKAVTPKAPPKRRGVPSGTANFALQGNKWVVEFQDSNKELVIEEGAEIKHTVYVYGCYDCVIQVNKKVNQITIDSSKKVSIVCQAVVASVELVNTESCNAQVLGSCPQISVEKASGANIYLSKECLDAQIVTAKCDSVNVSVPTDDGFDEQPIPEQFVTKVVGGKLVTTEVEHGD